MLLVSPDIDRRIGVPSLIRLVLFARLHSAWPCDVERVYLAGVGVGFAGT